MSLLVAVLGAGNIAQQHLPVLKALPECDLVSIVDTNSDTLTESADRFDIPNRYGSIDDLLDQNRPDAAFVLVSVLHVADVVTRFLTEKIPTFTEKPPGLYTHQTRALANLAKETHTPAMVGVNRRFYSSLIEGRKRLLEEGPIRSVTVDAHEDIERLRTGTKFPPEVIARWSAANGIHALDLLRYFGGDVASIDAIQQTVEGPMPDGVTATLKFENGAHGRAAMDWFAPGDHRFEARTEGATLTSNRGYGTVLLRRRGKDPEESALSDIDREYKAGFHLQDQTFLQSVINGVPFPSPACTLDDAVKTMEMIDAICGHADV
jgi:predicted dehydrogenase